MFVDLGFHGRTPGYRALAKRVGNVQPLSCHPPLEGREMVADSLDAR
jgi:hypothetical protein